MEKIERKRPRPVRAVGGVLAVLVLLGVAGVYWLYEEGADSATARRPETLSVASSSGADPATEPPPDVQQGFLYGRVTSVVGATFEGRLRWGGGEEAFWSDYFNGFKDENPWAAHVPPEKLPTVRRSFEVFGIEIHRKERPADLGRFFMARFGDVQRIDALGLHDVQVTLKSGSVFNLDRNAASDFDDDVHVWVAGLGVDDLDSRLIASIEFLPTPPLEGVPERLHGTVRTARQAFTGFLQWNRQQGTGADELLGHTEDGEVSVRFDAIRSIARHTSDSSQVTLTDGREVVLSGTREVGQGHQGIYVDDPRYGRVLVSWDAFERVDFSPGGSGPAYDDFPPGRPLQGSVTLRAGKAGDGRRLTGRLVYDLDESETTETLDAPAHGVDYTLPFGRVASIVLPGPEASAGHARVILHGGEELLLELSGDLGPGNAGLLIFEAEDRSPEYVPWSEVERVDLESPRTPLLAERRDQ